MTTEQKTAAIIDILANHQDNVAAVNAAQVHPGLDPYVKEAMNDSMKNDLGVIFSYRPARTTRRGRG